MLVEIPAAAAAGVPHRILQPQLQLVVESVLGGASRGQCLRPELVAALDRIGDVANLRFDHEHHGVVPQPGVRPQQEEQVGHAGDRDPAMRADALAIPPVHQVLAVLPLDLHVGVGVGDVEAGGVHDHVDRAFGPIGSDNAVARDSADAVGNQLGLRVRHGTVIGGGVQDSLATDAIVRRQLAAQFAILHRAANVVLTVRLDELQRIRALGHAEPQSLLCPVDTEARQRS